MKRGSAAGARAGTQGQRESYQSCCAGGQRFWVPPYLQVTRLRFPHGGWRGVRCRICNEVWEQCLEAGGRHTRWAYKAVHDPTTPHAVMSAQPDSLGRISFPPFTRSPYAVAPWLLPLVTVTVEYPSCRDGHGAGTQVSGQGMHRLAHTAATLNSLSPSTATRPAAKQRAAAALQHGSPALCASCRGVCGCTITAEARTHHPTQV